jgi:hypothetical protein
LGACDAAFLFLSDDFCDSAAGPEEYFEDSGMLPVLDGGYEGLMLRLGIVPGEFSQWTLRTFLFLAKKMCGIGVSTNSQICRNLVIHGHSSRN